MADSLDSQLGFTWESPGPAQVAAICRLLGSSWRVALGRIQVGADLSLHHPGNPRACAPSGQLQTTRELHHSAPAQLNIHRGWKLVISVHSQSLPLTGPSKSLPLTCQKQSRLNYKRRVHSVHMKGAPRVPSLGNKGGCATGPYGTPAPRQGVIAALPNT